MSHTIIDPDLHFIVDADTRAITNMTGQKLTIMQYDHNSERATFEIPRHIEGHDMSECNQVVILFVNAGKGTDVASDTYTVTDLIVDPNNTEKLTCSWLISRDATQYKGSLKFQIQFVCHADETNGIPQYYWHSDQCDMIEVKASLMFYT